MNTIALSEAEVHELHGAAWNIWQYDIGDEPTAAELGDHLKRTRLVLRLVGAAESGECEASEPIIDRLAAYEVECAERAEEADMDGDRESWMASAATVHDLLGRLREIAPPETHCRGCGTSTDALDTDGPARRSAQSTGGCSGHTTMSAKTLPLMEEDAGLLLGAIKRLLMGLGLGDELEERIGADSDHLKPEEMEYIAQHLVRCAQMTRDARAQRLSLDDGSLGLLAELSEDAQALSKVEEEYDGAHPDDLTLARARAVKLGILCDVTERHPAVLEAA